MINCFVNKKTNETAVEYFQDTFLCFNIFIVCYFNHIFNPKKSHKEVPHEFQFGTRNNLKILTDQFRKSFASSYFSSGPRVHDWKRKEKIRQSRMVGKLKKIRHKSSYSRTNVQSKVHKK